MKRGILIGVVAGLLIGAGAATAATQYLITSVHQIKPTVVQALRGQRGPAGPRGATGFLEPDATSEVPGNPATVAPGSSVTVVAACPTGNTLLLGGGYQASSGTDLSVSTDDASVESDSWQVTATNSSTASITLRADAICAQIETPGGSEARRAPGVPTK